MIPVRYFCRVCDADLGVAWRGVNDEDEPRPKCEAHPDTNPRGDSNANVVAFGKSGRYA